jgi:hypothetical protein
MLDDFVAAHCSNCGAVLPLGDTQCPLCGADDRSDLGNGLSDAVDVGAPVQAPSPVRQLRNLGILVVLLGVFYWLNPLFGMIVALVVGGAIGVGVLLRLLLSPTVMQGLVLTVEAAFQAAVRKAEHEAVRHGSRAAKAQIFGRRR